MEIKNTILSHTKQVIIMKKSKTEEKEKPSWLNYTKEEVEKLIIKLAKKGSTQSNIGLILRDQYGIPDVKFFNLRIKDVVEKKEIPEDLFNLLKKVVVMYNHLEANKKDKKGKHRIQLIESKIRRLAKYYKRKNVLPSDWKYDIKKVKLIVK